MFHVLYHLRHGLNCHGDASVIPGKQKKPPRFLGIQETRAD